MYNATANALNLNSMQVQSYCKPTFSGDNITLPDVDEASLPDNGTIEFEYKPGKTIPVKVQTNDFSKEQLEDALNQGFTKFKDKFKGKELPDLPESDNFYLYAMQSRQDSTQGALEIGYTRVTLADGSQLEPLTTDAYTSIKNKDKANMRELKLSFYSMLVALYKYA